MKRRSKPIEGIEDSINAKRLKAEAVRLREEARLIKIAKSTGFFDRYALNKDIKLMFEAFVQNGSPKQSQLIKLKNEVSVMSTRQSAQDRKDDTRRKILMGSFLMAQFEHKPDLLIKLQDELERFLDLHKDKAAAEANKELLGAWLGRTGSATKP